MSASTVGISTNPSLALGSKTNARRRAVSVTEKKSFNEAVAEGGGVSEAADADGKDISHSIKGEMVLEKQKEVSLQVKKALINSSISPRRRKAVVSKSEKKPTWRTVLSVFTKNFLLLLIFLVLVLLFRKFALNSDSGDGTVSPMGILDFEGRIAEVEALLKKTTKIMQAQVEVVDRKIESQVGGLRREFSKQVEEKGMLFEDVVNRLEVRTDGLDKTLGELRTTSFFTEEDFKSFSDEWKKSRSLEDGVKDLSLDEIRAVAREIVEKEIEKHAADGLGRVDYALASGGAMVVDHSDPYYVEKGASWSVLSKWRNQVHVDAQKMLQPSFGMPGDCFPLRGSNGFVNIRLRAAIIPEAVTLEHVARSVAYDRTSAPKNCRVLGWFQGHNAHPSSQPKKVLLGDFVYDLERSNAQTFNVESADSGIVNMVRFEFTSNHGSPKHTCIYRLRVHGQEPDSVEMLEVQS